MSEASLMLAAYDELLTVFTAALPDGFTIYDGPQVALPVDQDMLLYGVQDPTAPSFSVAVSGASQDWADLGALNRDQSFSIWSTLIAWSGAPDDLAVCRRRLKTNFALLGNALREPANVGLNGVLDEIAGWCGIADTQYQQIQTQEGCAAHLQFIVQCQARI